MSFVSAMLKKEFKDNGAALKIFNFYWLISFLSFPYLVWSDSAVLVFERQDLPSGTVAV
jgi:hypothetical protein